MKQLKIYTIIGIIFVLITGSISHFVYEWTDNNFIAGLIFPINESVWEHMKLVFFPMLLYSFIMEKKLISLFPCISSALSAGIISGTILVPVLFYTYTGILGYDVFILDIITFALSVIAAFIIVYKLTLSCASKKYSAFLHIIVYIFIICFMIFSVFPPDLGIFVSPTK